MTENNTSSNKRIAKNTLVLYIRMFFVLIVGLYTSRVVLNSLGVSDFGVYNVIGSIVLLFGYLNSALSLATTRFFSYEMPHGVERTKIVFNTSLKIQIVFSILIIIIAETIGLWLVNNKLVIPDDRIAAANWVYQFSIISMVISIIGVSYNSAITSHERMNIYAFISIIEVILKLLIALLITSTPMDNLIFYGLGILLVTGISFIIRCIYCLKNFEEVRFENSFNKSLFQQMFAFVGWNFFGATAGMSVGQGLNFIINIFFGPTVNAARGIAFQVEGAVVQFVTNINTAVNPQIVKRYSVGDMQSMFSLVFFASKLSFILLLCCSLPIIIDAPYILQLWLGTVPEYAVLFTRLMLVYMLTISLTYSINMSAQASGNIKWFQIAEGSIVLCNIPAAIILYKIGLPAYVSFLAMIVFSVMAFTVKIMILKKTIIFPVRNYFNAVLVRIILITTVCGPLYVVAAQHVPSNIFLFCIKTLVYIIPVGLLCFFGGFTQSERDRIITTVNTFIKQRIGKNKTNRS